MYWICWCRCLKLGTWIWVSEEFEARRPQRWRGGRGGGRGGRGGDGFFSGLSMTTCWGVDGKVDWGECGDFWRGKGGSESLKSAILNLWDDWVVVTIYPLVVDYVPNCAWDQIRCRNSEASKAFTFLKIWRATIWPIGNAHVFLTCVVKHFHSKMHV